MLSTERGMPNRGARLEIIARYFLRNYITEKMR